MLRDPFRSARRAALVLSLVLVTACGGGAPPPRVANHANGADLRLARPASSPLPAWAASLLVPREISASGASLAYDPGRDQAVLFGGRAGRELLTDTWVWSPGGFVRRAPTASPSARMNAAMAFDPNRGRVLLFGGRNGDTVYGDTWEWDGESWRTVETEVAPPPRSEAQMVYDVARRRLVLFGGHTGRVRAAADATGRINTPIALGDTWAWDGTRWTELGSPPAEATSVADAGTDAGADAGVASPASPTPRAWFALGYDPRLERVVLFGGRDGFSNFLADTWTHDGTRWTRLDVTEGPPGRTAAALVFDPSLGRLVLVAGVYAGTPPESLADDAWTFDGARWLPFDMTSRDHPRGAVLGAYLAPHERAAFFTVREANEVDASTAALLQEGTLTVVTATRQAPPSVVHEGRHELLADTRAQLERWLAVAEDAHALASAREHARTGVVNALVVAEPAVRRALGARAMALVLASDQPTMAFRLLATPREWLASEDEIEPILLELEALAEQQFALCTADVFAQLPSGVRVRVHAHRLAPSDAVFTREDVFDPRFNDTEVLRDALVLAVGRRSRDEAERLAERILAIDGLDGFALVARAALDDGAPDDALDALDAYYATVTGSRGTCLDVDAVTKLQRYATAHPSDWTSFAMESIGTTFDPRTSDSVHIDYRDIPIDRAGGLRTLLPIVRAMRRDHVLPRAVQESPFFSDYERSVRPSPRAAPRVAASVCPGLSSADRQRVLERTRSLLYDDPIAAFLDTPSFGPYPARVCLARALGPSSAPLFEGLEAVRFGAATRDQVLFALVELDPGAFAPFARAVIRAAHADGLALSDASLAAIRGLDPYRAARAIDPRFTLAAEDDADPATLSARLLHAASLQGSAAYAAAGPELEALAPLSTEPNELLALAGVAYALADEPASRASAERLAERLAAVDPTSARSLAVRDALAHAEAGSRPLDVYFPRAPSPSDAAPSSAAVPLLGRVAPSRECARRFDAARLEATASARLDAFERALDAAGLPTGLGADVGSVLTGEPVEDGAALAAAITDARVPLPLVCAMRQANEERSAWRPDVSSAISVRTRGNVCAGLPLTDEASVRILAYELRAPAGTSVFRGRLPEFVAHTDARPLDATNLDVLEARVLALGALGRDAPAAELRLALLGFSVRVRLDASAYRGGARVRAALEPLFGEAARFGFVDGDPDATAAFSRAHMLRERLVSEVRSGVFSRESRIRLAVVSIGGDDVLAALDASPRSLWLGVWALDQMYVVPDGPDRQRLLTTVRERLRRLAREAPTDIPPYSLARLDNANDRALLREICRAVEARAIAEEPEYPEEVVDELVDDGYSICIGSFRTRMSRDAADDDEEY